MRLTSCRNKLPEVLIISGGTISKTTIFDGYGGICDYTRSALNVNDNRLYSDRIGEHRSLSRRHAHEKWEEREKSDAGE